MTKTKTTPRVPKYRISFQCEAASAPSMAKKLKDALGIDVSAQIEKINNSPSRADRLEEAGGLVQDGRCEVESLRDELQDWYDNLRENFQNGDKGQQLQDAIDSLDTIANELDSVDFGSVEFPSMMG